MNENDRYTDQPKHPVWVAIGATLLQVSTLVAFYVAGFYSAGAFR